MRDIGEDALIARLLTPFPPSTLCVGPGDDCAVVDDGHGPWRLLKTDAIVEGIHFLREAPPEKVGWKACARVISDFAAMGGSAREIMITLACPPDLEIHWVEGLYQGIARCLAAHEATLAGGETTSVPDGGPIMISVAGTGQVDRRHCVLRSGGQPGDVIAVTGTLGGSIHGKHLDFQPRCAEGALLAQAGASAMMDLSDGIAKDLPRLAQASHCQFEWIPEALPVTPGCTPDQALGDGEDYELLFAISPARWHALVLKWPEELAPIHAVGRLLEGPFCESAIQGGWEHFRT
nr:thiamine-phosphate kinase [Haloferula luteola]